MILVTYSTKYGSTKEVAEAVAAAMQEAGALVETRPMRDVPSLDAYDGLVLGTALYMGSMHADARRFLSTHRAALAARPAALFILGPVQKIEKDWDGARQQLKKQLAKYPWFTPVSAEILGGAFDPKKLGFPLTLIPALRKMPPNDCRDWQAIGAWAREQIALLQPARPA